MKLSLEMEKLEKFVLRKVSEINPECFFDDNLTVDAKQALTFFSLCKLFPVQTIAATNEKKTQWRPSRLEVRDSFLLHVQAYRDLKDTLSTRRKRLEQYGLSDQPLPVVIGETTKNFEKCLVVFDSCEYEVETPMKAVDIAFKIYHALHAWYPPESDQLWHFIQKAVYKFNSKWDKFYPKVEELVIEYENI